MDTTLRDGEQTPDVAYTPAEKLQLARILLSEVKVDRIEIASTRVSEGEREAARLITDWARKKRLLPRVEMLGYCDGRASVDWVAGAGGRVMNLLVKGSERHCRTQLGMSPQEHRDAVAQTARNARRKRIRLNAYLEDWSNGVRDSFDYVFAMVEQLLESGVERIYLADTLGVFAPDDTSRYVGLMTATWPEIVFEFHGHNDYGLANANCLAAVGAGARGVHTSVNGMGERTGNTRLAEIVATLHDHSRVPHGRGRIAALVDLGARRDVLGQGHRREHARRGPRRVHTDRGHPRRRRHEGRSLREPARARPLRRPPQVRARQALGQGVARPQPQEPRHRAAARRPRARAEADRRPRRQEAHRGRRGPALHHRRRAQDARGAARARARLPRRGGHGRAAARRGDARVQAPQRVGARRTATAATTRS